MPGVLQLAVPQGVLPFALCRAFQRQKMWPMRSNWFPDGSSLRNRFGQSDQSSWSLTQRLTVTQLQALRAFYINHKGPMIPFYFYDYVESNFHYDPTGTALLGRYTVCFQGSLLENTLLSRHDVPFILIQVS